MALARVPADRLLHVPELVDVARDVDGPLLVEPVLVLRLSQQVHEPRVVHVGHRDHEPPLLLALPHGYGHAPSRHVLQVVSLLPLVVVVVAVEVEVEVGQVEMKAWMVATILVDAPHHLKKNTTRKTQFATA
ncbi:uncharacterized protein J3R85_018733 [Psidium guajava]|nr:uncharacterized protein J3R85_018733 [Psidium guajava]